LDESHIQRRFPSLQGPAFQTCVNAANVAKKASTELAFGLVQDGDFQFRPWELDLFSSVVGTATEFYDFFATPGANQRIPARPEICRTDCGVGAAL
jgi:hypothetical protein